ncbi:uncharacterized protein [Amphiura filiformis]|uniref:uncharacterized protein n=1 Tax=Amphiura filiformis TaxID=82378 RepID=UPI003B221D4E
MDVTSVPDGDDTNLSVTPVSLMIYCSSALLITLCLVFLVAGIYSHCKSRTQVSRRTSATPVNASGHKILTGHNNDDGIGTDIHRYEQPRTTDIGTYLQPLSMISSDKTNETMTRTGTITAVVQINLGDIADGTISLDGTLNRALNAPTSMPTTKTTTTKIGTLPKYENTPVKSRNNYQHHDLISKNWQPSPYDYPVNLNLLQDDGVIGTEISGYMEVLSSTEDIYEAVDKKRRVRVDSV